MTKVKIGNLVRLKPPHIVKQQSAMDLDEEYDPNDWVGVVVGIPGSRRADPDQQELFETCLVMWRGRNPVGEFIDHLEVLQ